MHPVLFQFKLFGNSYAIGTYGIFIILAVVCGIALSIKVGVKLGFKKNDISAYVELIALGGLLGAFFTGFILFLPERIEAGFFKYPPVLVSWGGIIGGVITFLIIKKKWSFNVPLFLDSITPAYLLGYSIGRIGCFFGGCCFGELTDSVIGVCFNDPIAPASIMNGPVIPTQLISSFVLFIMSVIFFLFVHFKLFPGKIFFISVICYSIFRFVIEFYRSDQRGWFLGFSDGQWFSILALITSLLFLFRFYKIKKINFL